VNIVFLQRGELAIDRTHNMEIQRMLSTIVTTELNNLNQSKLISQDQQLLNINCSISIAATEHSALIESQMLQSDISSHSSTSSVYDSDSCGDTKDLNHVDLEANNHVCCTNADFGSTELEIVTNKPFDPEHEVDFIRNNDTVSVDKQ